MSNNNSNQPAKKPKFSIAINTPGFQKLINNTLGDPGQAKRFVCSVTSAVAANPDLQNCDAGTILAAAFLGESLNLSPSPQLGQYYLVPFKQKEKRDRQGNVISQEIVKAQFVLGYKGYIQLAIRSGQYTKLNVMEIKEGELKTFDPLNEIISCNLIEDWEAREEAATIGYYAMFEYVNGFRKAIYWSRNKMLSHADKYSPAFSASAFQKLLNGEIPNHELWKYSSFWYKNFDEMAKKTMLRHIISHWGILSTEIATAIERDSSVTEIDSKNDFLITPESELKALEPATSETVERIDLSEV